MATMNGLTVVDGGAMGGVVDGAIAWNEDGEQVQVKYVSVVGQDAEARRQAAAARWAATPKHCMTISSLSWALKSQLQANTEVMANLDFALDQRELIKDAATFLSNIASRVDHARFMRACHSTDTRTLDWLLGVLDEDEAISEEPSEERSGMAGWIPEHQAVADRLARKERNKAWLAALAADRMASDGADSVA